MLLLSVDGQRVWALYGQYHWKSTFLRPIVKGRVKFRVSFAAMPRRQTNRRVWRTKNPSVMLAA
jgi:hypothetical protein